MRQLILAAVAAAVLAAPASASAAPPWSVAAPVGAGAFTATEPKVAFGNGGAALVAWPVPCAPCGPTGLSRRTRLATGRAGGSYRVFRTVAGDLADEPAAYGRTRMVLLRARPARRGARRGRIRLGISFGRVTGDVNPMRTLDRYLDGDGAALTANDKGHTVAVWIERRRNRDLLWMAERRPARRFGKRRVIRSGRRMSDVDAAIGAGGDLVVAYRRGDRLEARWRRGSGRLRRPQRLGRTDDFTQLDTVVAPNGRMLVAWGAQDGGIEANEPYVVRAALRPAGPRRFRRAATVDAGGTTLRPEGPVRAALAPDGTGAVAWTAVVRPPGAVTTYPVRVARVDRDGITGGAEQLADSGRLGEVTAAEDGTATVVWTRLGGDEGLSPGPVQAALRPRSAPRFGAAETVSDLVTAGQPAMALDPQTGRPTAVWAQLPQPPTTPAPDPDATVVASTRGG